MKKKTFTAFLLVCTLCISLCMPLLAAETDSAGNLVKAGETVSLSEIPFFGAWVLGRDVTAKNATAKGSVFAGGASVTFDGATIDETLYTSGGTVSVKDSIVKGNIYAAGMDVEVSGKSSCNGAYIRGNDISFEGKTNILNASGNSVKVGGTIIGDAVIDAKKVEIAPKTIITGKLKISSEKEPVLPEEARIGSYTFVKKGLAPKAEKPKQKKKAAQPKKKEADEESTVSPLQEKMKDWFYWLVATLALGMLMSWLFAGHLTRAAGYVMNRTRPFIGSGIAGLIAIPVIAILLCITGYLAPAGIITLILYGIFLFTGIAFAGASIPRIFLPKLNIFLTTLIGITALQILKEIPYIGGLVGIAARMYLLAYVIQYVWINRLKKF